MAEKREKRRGKRRSGEEKEQCFLGAKRRGGRAAGRRQEFSLSSSLLRADELPIHFIFCRFFLPFSLSLPMFLFKFGSYFLHLLYMYIQ